MKLSPSHPVLHPGPDLLGNRSCNSQFRNCVTFNQCLNGSVPSLVQQEQNREGYWDQGPTCTQLSIIPGSFLRLCEVGSGCSLHFAAHSNTGTEYVRHFSEGEENESLHPHRSHPRICRQWWLCLWAGICPGTLARAPCAAVSNRSWPCPSPQEQAIGGAGGVLRRTEMKLFLSARIHTPKPRITAPRICKERGSQWKPRNRWVRKLPRP